MQVTLHDTSGEHDDIEALVLSGEVDLGLGRLPMHPELSCQALFADEYLVITAAHQPRLSSWEALHRAALIVCEEDCAPFVAAHIARHSRPPRPAVRLKDAQVALGMVAEGHGFTVLTSLVVCPLPSGLHASAAAHTAVAQHRQRGAPGEGRRPAHSGFSRRRAVAGRAALGGGTAGKPAAFLG